MSDPAPKFYVGLLSSTISDTSYDSVWAPLKAVVATIDFWCRWYISEVIPEIINEGLRHRKQGQAKSQVKGAF